MRTRHLLQKRVRSVYLLLLLPRRVCPLRAFLVASEALHAGSEVLLAVGLLHRRGDGRLHLGVMRGTTVVAERCLSGVPGLLLGAVSDLAAPWMSGLAEVLQTTWTVAAKEKAVLVGAMIA